MKYYIILNEVQLGPLDMTELSKLSVSPQTPVWTEGMPDWVPAGSVPELAPLFVQTSNRPPQYGNGSYDPYAASFSSGQPQEPRLAPGMNNSSYVPPRPDNYLAWSIVVTVMCCIPFGIVAIIKSCEVNTAYDQGRYEQAEKSSNAAKNWILVSVITGLLTCAVWGGLNLMPNLLNNF